MRQNIIVILVVSEWTATGITSQQVSDGSECTFTVMAKVKKFSPYPTQLKTREHVLEWFGRRVVVIVDLFP